jgi:hypothetical protein
MVQISIALSTTAVRCRDRGLVVVNIYKKGRHFQAMFESLKERDDCIVLAHRSL